jgi:hypothetical protein
VSEYPDDTIHGMPGPELSASHMSSKFISPSRALVAHDCNPSNSTEIRRIKVGSHPRQIVYKTLSQENPSQKRAGIGPEFKPQYQKKKKKKSLPPERVLNTPNFLAS